MQTEPLAIADRIAAVALFVLLLAVVAGYSEAFERVGNIRVGGAVALLYALARLLYVSFTPKRPSDSWAR